MDVIIEKRGVVQWHLYIVFMASGGYLQGLFMMDD